MGKVKLNHRRMQHVVQRDAILDVLSRIDVDAICYCEGDLIPVPTPPEERDTVRAVAELCIAGYRWAATQPGGAKKIANVAAFRTLMLPHLERLACHALVCVFCNARGYIPGSDTGQPYVLILDSGSGRDAILHAYRVPVVSLDNGQNGIEGVYASALRPVWNTLGTLTPLGGDEGEGG